MNFASCKRVVLGVVDFVCLCLSYNLMHIQWNLQIIKVLGQPIFFITCRFSLLRGTNVLECMQMQIIYIGKILL